MSDISAYYADTDAPIAPLEIKSHFESLTGKEKQYAHHFSRAAYAGTRVGLRQVSPESEALYDLIMLIHGAVKQSNDYCQELCKIANVTKEDVRHYLEYASQVLNNLGNYKSFGDVKFIPRLSVKAFEAISSIDEGAAKIFNDIGVKLYQIEPQALTLLGYPDQGHVSTYYGGGITKAEIDAIKTFTETIDFMPENSRLFKVKDGLYYWKVASGDVTREENVKFNLPGDMGTLEIVLGDHSKEMNRIADELVQALKVCANDNEVEMISHYVLSFRTGNMEAHKQSQREWIKDVGPTVETNIGFIETYRDPAGVRGEWEGLVAVVNKERTRAFSQLVNRAEFFLCKLPWDKEFEKDTFKPPDFTSLEVLTFAGSGIPAGINIPNYDDVRQSQGFKNVSLGNVLSAKSRDEKLPFILDDDQEKFQQLKTPAFEIQVGIHELLGHGSGKLFQEISPGKFNFDYEHRPISPIDGKPISTYYKMGQTWGSLFGSIAGSYEECRAEAVAMYLSVYREILSIFGHDYTHIPEGQVADVIYIGYLSMARAGLCALEFYDPKTKKWGQPHMQARYSILKTFLQAGSDFVKLEYTRPDYSDLVIRLDRNKILSHGQPAIGKYLEKLHIYKSTGDVENGTKFYNSMTSVDDDQLGKFRPIVLKKKLPRKQFVQANTFLDNNDGNVTLKEYDATPVGVIQSFYDRNV